MPHMRLLVLLGLSLTACRGKVDDNTGGTVGGDDTDDAAPTASLTPLTDDGSQRYADVPLSLSGTVADVEDPADTLIVTWTSSLDGALGNDPADGAGAVALDTLLTEGTHTLTLTVEDSAGQTGNDSVELTVGAANSAPTCGVTSPADGSAAPEGDVVSLQGWADDADIGPEALTGTWTSDVAGELWAGSPDADGTFGFDTSTLALATHALTGDPLFKAKAVDLGDRLLFAFKSKSKVPFSDVNLGTHHAHKPKWGPDSSTSEVTTIQLEFRELSRLTGDPKYADAVNEVMLHVHQLPKKDGLVPIFINADTGKFSGSRITLGARGDSYYEYLLKQWLQSGKTDGRWRDMYVETVDGIMKNLVKTSSGPMKLTYIAELSGKSPRPKMDHLVCFLPGTLALGHAHGLPRAHLELAEKLIETCYAMYTETATGLAPEIAYFGVGSDLEDLKIKPADAHNLLRPETVESLFIMRRITGEDKYREWGWKIYEAFEKHCPVAAGGYSSLKSVLKDPPEFRDKMESFFLGETLKYLFLLFEDEPSITPLDGWVYNTEAHPLPIYAGVPHA